MATDYARDPAQHFAERRGITFRERVAEIVRKVVPEKARSMFAGFRPAPQAQRGVATERKAKAGALDIGRDVERYARAEQDIERMRQKGLSPMLHQEAALEKARAALNEMKPKAGRDLAVAFSRQSELVAEAASGRTANAVRAMQLEAEIRTNPAMRADRFVENWQRLRWQREQAFQSGNYSRAEAVTSSMGAMAKGLQRDVQVDSLLRNRKIELGLHASGSGGIGHQLTQYLGLGRGRGLGIGMKKRRKMEQETVTAATIDPAAMAFDLLRSEVLTLRLAVQQLAAAPGEIEIPDYTETLTEMRDATAALVDHYKKLREAPSLSVTPDQLAAQINAASGEARKAERQSLQSAENSFVTIARELTGFVESARTSDRQNKWLVGAFLLGIATCAAFVILATRRNSAELPAPKEVRPTVQKLR